MRPTISEELAASKSDEVPAARPTTTTMRLWLSAGSLLSLAAGLAEGLRRLCAMADVKAHQIGVPDTAARRLVMCRLRVGGG